MAVPHQSHPTRHRRGRAGLTGWAGHRGGRLGVVAAGLVVLAVAVGMVVGPAQLHPVHSEVAGHEPVNLWQFEHLAVKPDPANPATWDWTRALAAAISHCKATASWRYPVGGGQYRTLGLPTLYLPRGIYRNTATHLLEYLHGFTIRGDGKGSTVIQHEAAGYLFDLHRSGALAFEDFTIQGVAPTGPVGGLRGLVEHSGGFRFRQSSRDPLPGAGTTWQNHVAVEVNEVHRAFRFEGDQMTDSLVADRYHGRDNFIDFDYANSQAVNHQLNGGEVTYGVSWPASDYATRLASWSSRPKLEDGAVVNATSGGQLTVTGGSIIARKPTLYFHSPPQDGSHGAISNVTGYSFTGTRWEVRHADTAKDRFGLERLTMVRYAAPFPTSASVQPSVRFSACDWIVMTPSVDLFYIANAVRISAHSSRVFYPSAGNKARVVSLLNSSTPAIKGTYRSWGTTPLTRVRKAAPGYTAPSTLDQQIEMTN
jgi:hypothetical protein